MTDYRSFVESKLADLDRRRAEIEAEREQLMTALGVMDEADASERRTAVVAAATIPRPTPVPVAVTGILRSSGQMLTADDIYNRLSDEREVSRPHLHSALHRLKTRNIAFKAGNMWGLVGRDDTTSVNPERGSSPLTNPTAH